MRAAGVPARVVTGYLGGEWNPVGGYLIVRQSDAHAWTEVWLEGQGWTRIDPTAVVAPERLQRGIFDLLSDSLPATSSSCTTAPVLSASQQLWDGANQWWQERVMEFNLRAQLNLLRNSASNHRDWQHLGWAFAAGLLMWIAWVSLSLRRSVARVKPDRIGRAWLRRRASWLASRRRARPRKGRWNMRDDVGTARPDLAARMDGARGALRAAAIRTRSQPPGRSRASSARSGILRCDAHAPQQHAADHEQQHQRDDRARARRG